MQIAYFLYHKAIVALLILGKIHFKTKSVEKNKKGHFMMMTESTH